MVRGRAQFQVLVIPFFRRPDGSVLYCLLRRADRGYWQWIAGGGEGSETPSEAARRESLEETGIAGPLFALTMKAYVPVDAFADYTSWPSDLYVIPEYAFAVQAPTLEVSLSHEHTETRWAPYQEATGLLHWQSNQTALWELARRIERSDLRSAD